MTHDGRMFVCVGTFCRMREYQGCRMSWERRVWDAECVTCGAERNERQRVLADHRQLVFGQGQPVDDVLYEVVGDDRGHVPPQLPKYNQFPVLQRQ